MTADSEAHQAMPKPTPAPQGLSRRHWFRKAFSLAPLAGFSGYVSDSFFWAPRRLKVRYKRVAGAGAGARWVQFTDVHFKGDTGYLEEVVERITSLKPDFVVFTGDLVEEPQFVKPACDILRKLPVPMYAIPGNHDHWAGADFRIMAEACRRTGGEWLQDRTAMAPNGRIRLIGFDRQTAPVEPISGMFNLVMIHYPAWADGVPFKADLILAGHTHGGQVRLPGIGALVLPHATNGYDLGDFQTAGGPLYVNPGIGTFHMDIRFRCPPELTVFEST